MAARLGLKPINRYDVSFHQKILAWARQSDGAEIEVHESPPPGPSRFGWTVMLVFRDQLRPIETYLVKTGWDWRKDGLP